MPCQEWMEFQPSRSSAVKAHEAERASHLSLGDLTPFSISILRAESFKRHPRDGVQGEVPKGRYPAFQPTTEWIPCYLQLNPASSTSLVIKVIKNSPFRIADSDCEAWTSMLTCPSQWYSWDWQARWEKIKIKSLQAEESYRWERALDTCRIMERNRCGPWPGSLRGPTESWGVTLSVHSQLPSRLMVHLKVKFWPANKASVTGCSLHTNTNSGKERGALGSQW